MEALSLAAIMRAIHQADGCGKPAFIFNFVPEHTVWQHARVILDDPDQGCLVGPTLLHGIREAFGRIQDRAAARDILLHALNPPADSLVYHAAQEAVLSHAQDWDNEAAKQFYASFQDCYLKTVKDNDQFVAALALEGSVMLPIYRGDEQLLYKAIGLLLNDFPSIPDDPQDPALLPVRALKLLGRCYDLRPNDSLLAQKIQEYVGVRNIAVDTEARFNLGLVRLYDAFRASDAATLQEALRAARDRFEEAFTAEDDRTDAELFLTISQCYLLLLTTPFPSQVSKMVRNAQEVLTERLLSFGGAMSSSRATVEFNFVRLITHLERWAEQLATAERWPSIVPRMRILADTYAAVRQFEATEGFIDAASRITRDLVMLPQIQSQFVKVQEIVAKLESILADRAWRETASESEVAFYELAMREVRANSPPKDKAAAELERVRAAAEQDAPVLAQSIGKFLARGMKTNDVLIQVCWQRIEEERKTERAMLAYSPAQDIYDKTIAELIDKLGWNPNSLKWKSLKQAIRYTAHYFFLTYRASPGETGMKFLFAEEVKGLGQGASEAHLRDHFYSKMRWICENAKLERESREAVPGRPDLIYRFPENIDFPIEVKCEDSDVRPEHIHGRYIAQAQSYAAGAGQVSFLFVLDTTRKELGTPLKNSADYWYIDRRSVPGAECLDYVVVVIFPANRYRPSDHSWRRKKSITA